MNVIHSKNSCYLSTVTNCITSCLAVQPFVNICKYSSPEKNFQDSRRKKLGGSTVMRKKVLVEISWRPTPYNGVSKISQPFQMGPQTYTWNRSHRVPIPLTLGSGSESNINTCIDQHNLYLLIIGHYSEKTNDCYFKTDYTAKFEKI